MRCQGNYGVKLEAVDETNNDYLVIKSFGLSTFMIKGGDHIQNMALNTFIFRKRYAHRKHDLSYEDFPFHEIKVDEKTLQALSNDDKSNLKKYGLNIDF